MTRHPMGVPQSVKHSRVIRCGIQTNLLTHLPATRRVLQRRPEAKLPVDIGTSLASDAVDEIGFLGVVALLTGALVPGFAQRDSKGPRAASHVCILGVGDVHMPALGHVAVQLTQCDAVERVAWSAIYGYVSISLDLQAK